MLQHYQPETKKCQIPNNGGFSGSVTPLTSSFSGYIAFAGLLDLLRTVLRVFVWYFIGLVRKSTKLLVDWN